MSEAPPAAPLWSAAWVDLLDGLAGARVLLVSRSPARSEAALADAGAAVTVAADDAPRLPSGTWDLVALERVRPDLLPSAARLAAVDGRVALLVDNRLSPLRLLDRLTGRGDAGPAVAGPRALGRLLSRAGLEPGQVFGLLRSSLSPVTAFDLSAPRATTAVLTAAAVRLTGRRLGALRLLLRLGSGRSAAVPAWLVVARHPGSSLGSTPADAITGRLGYDDSREPKVVRGEPPAALDKHYHSLQHAEAESMALEVLERSGFPHAPRVLARPAPLLVRQSWAAGQPLHPDEMDPDEVDAWLGRAAAVLRRVHELTRRPDGEVLVHGDYWLGNVLAEDDRVVAVVDWTEARWGDGQRDARSLVDSLAAAGLLSADRVEAARALVAAELDGQ